MIPRLYALRLKSITVAVPAASDDVLEFIISPINLNLSHDPEFKLICPDDGLTLGRTCEPVTPKDGLSIFKNGELTTGSAEPIENGFKA